MKQRSLPDFGPLGGSVLFTAALWRISKKNLLVDLNATPFGTSSVCGSVAKLRMTVCYMQYIAIFILGEFNMQDDPKILRQNR